jgi:hypothetical protein
MNTRRSVVAIALAAGTVAACFMLPIPRTEQIVAENLSSSDVIVEVDQYDSGDIDDIVPGFVSLPQGATKVIDLVGHPSRGPANVTILGLDCATIAKSAQDVFSDGGTVTVKADGSVLFDSVRQYPWTSPQPSEDDLRVATCEAAVDELDQ